MSRMKKTRKKAKKKGTPWKILRPAFLFFIFAESRLGCVYCTFWIPRFLIKIQLQIFNCLERAASGIRDCRKVGKANGTVFLSNVGMRYYNRKLLLGVWCARLLLASHICLLSENKGQLTENLTVCTASPTVPQKILFHQSIHTSMEYT